MNTAEALPVLLYLSTETFPSLAPEFKSSCSSSDSATSSGTVPETESSTYEKSCTPEIVSLADQLSLTLFEEDQPVALWELLMTGTSGIVMSTTMPFEI